MHTILFVGKHKQGATLSPQNNQEPFTEGSIF